MTEEIGKVIIIVVVITIIIIGKVEIATQHLINGQEIDAWFPIRKAQKENGQLKLNVQYVSMSVISQGYEVESYFPMHRGCNVKLYQDTSVPADLPWLNMVQGPNGLAPTYHSCWRDLYYDLEAAQHIITITRVECV